MEGYFIKKMKKEMMAVSALCLFLIFFALVQPAQAEDASLSKQSGDAGLAQELTDPLANLINNFEFYEELNAVIQYEPANSFNPNYVFSYKGSFVDRAKPSPCGRRSDCRVGFRLGWLYRQDSQINGHVCSGAVLLWIK